MPVWAVVGSGLLLFSSPPYANPDARLLQTLERLMGAQVLVGGLDAQDDHKSQSLVRFGVGVCFSSIRRLGMEKRLQ